MKQIIILQYDNAKTDETAECSPTVGNYGKDCLPPEGRNQVCLVHCDVPRT